METACELSQDQACELITSRNAVFQDMRRCNLIVGSSAPETAWIRSVLHLSVLGPSVLKAIKGKRLTGCLPGAFWPGRYMTFRSPEQLRMAGKAGDAGVMSTHTSGSAALRWMRVVTSPTSS